MAYAEKLQQTGRLFHHGPESRFFWGRGNGWCAAAFAELLVAEEKDQVIDGAAGAFQTIRVYRRVPYCATALAANISAGPFRLRPC